MFTYLLGLLGLGSELECYQAKNVLHLHRHVVACQRHVPPAHSSIEFLFCPVYPGVGGVSTVREFIEESIKSGFESGQGQEGLDGGRDHVVQCRGSRGKGVEPQVIDTCVLGGP